MTERWLQHRHAYGEVLRVHARATDSKEVHAMWERYGRQTARMRATDEQLRRELPSDFTVMTGERLRYKGQEIYLEHLVIGPTGLFLLETFEGLDESWQKGLALNLSFCRKSLGTNTALLNGLVIQRGAVLPVLPAGVNLVPGVEVALHVIRDQRAGMELNPALANEIRRVVEAVRISTPPGPPRLSWKQRLQWRELLRLANLPWLFLAIKLAVMSTIWPMSAPAGLAIFGPFVGVWHYVATRRPERSSRELGIKVLLGIETFFIIGYALISIFTPRPRT